MIATLSEGDERGKCSSKCGRKSRLVIFLQISLINHFSEFVSPCFVTGEQEVEKTKVMKP